MCWQTGVVRPRGFHGEFQLQTLLVGDFDRRGFVATAAFLGAACHTEYAADIPGALAHLAVSSIFPQVIVLAWPCPGAFSASEIGRLRCAAPLARQLAVLGSWCEGEGRSGEVIPGVIRTPWHQWVPTWGRDFQSASIARLPGWSLPETAGDDERLLWRMSRPCPPRHGLIAIASRQFDAAELYGAVCHRRGYMTVWLSDSQDLLRVSPPAAVIWDGDANRLDELSVLRNQSPAPIVALIDFPRTEDVQRAMEAGAAAVLGRPLLWDCLFRELDRIDALERAPLRMGA